MNFNKLSKIEIFFMWLILKNINVIIDFCKDIGVWSKYSLYLVLDLNMDFFFYYFIIIMVLYLLVVVVLMFYCGFF